MKRARIVFICLAITGLAAMAIGCAGGAVPGSCSSGPAKMQMNSTYAPSLSSRVTTEQGSAYQGVHGISGLFNMGLVANPLSKSGVMERVKIEQTTTP